jgi:hypothetical protein
LDNLNQRLFFIAGFNVKSIRTFEEDKALRLSILLQIKNDLWLHTGTMDAQCLFFIEIQKFWAWGRQIG